MIELDLSKQFYYENNFYLTAPINRISKFATHLELFRKVSNIAGDIVECGVFKGVSLSRLIKFRALFENVYSKKIIGFDIFGEFPEARFEKDVAKRAQFIREAGSRSIGKEEFITLLKKLELYQNIELVEGDILKTVPEYKSKNPHLKISLLHIDVDLHEATAVCLEELYPLVSRGGIVILDDYGAFAGANKAIDDFFADKKTRINKLPYANAISFVEKP
ncbi:MAG: class I SAM-dependent methyltransferase [Candidatus Omnitrophica bacterium]|nr:class I SAM-dependent methyltransferase [Candidatus Omnitrophota bacterium]